MENTEIALALLLLNMVTYATFAFDKWSSRRGGWRIPEANLLLLCLLGGSVMGLIAMFSLRHKTKKAKFRILIPLIIALQICAIGVIFAGMGAK